MFRGQLIYNFAVIASSLFQVGIFFKRKKNTARLKDFSWQKQNKNLGKKHLPVETSYNYKYGSGFDIKAQAAAETFADQHVEKKKLWYFEQSELCTCIRMSFQDGNSAEHPAHLSVCLLHLLLQQ